MKMKEIAGFSGAGLTCVSEVAATILEVRRTVQVEPAELLLKIVLGRLVARQEGGLWLWLCLAVVRRHGRGAGRVVGAVRAVGALRGVRGVRGERHCRATNTTGLLLLVCGDMFKV